MKPLQRIQTEYGIFAVELSRSRTMNYCPFCQLPLDRPLSQCPSCNADLSDHQGPAGGGTLKESIDDIRAHADSRKGGTLRESADKVRQQVNPQKDKMPRPRRGTPTVPLPRNKKELRGGGKGQDETDSALPFRPINRPPTLILCALDDGSREDGEWYRVRKPEFRIGRTTGETNHPNDLVISNDNGISSVHVEIRLRIEDGRYRYYLRDWPSRNGTFVRVSRAALKHKQELLIGARRYFFNAGNEARNASGSDGDINPAKSTQGWQALSDANASQMVPSLVEMTPRGNGNEFPLIDSECVIGSDAAQCSLTISGDPFVSSVHARIFRDKKNRWVIENINSLNGIWLRIEEMALDTGGEFQIGEQRFLVRIP